MIAKLIMYAPAQVAACISTFGLLATHTRLLEVKIYGVLALSLIFLEIARTVASQWIGGALIRLIPDSTEDKKLILAGTGLRITIALTAPAAILLAIAIIQYGLLTIQECIALIALLAIKSAYSHSIDLCRLQEKAKALSAISLSQAILSILATIILLHKDPTVFNALLALSISYLLPTLFTIKLFNCKYSKEEKNKILAYGAPILIASTLASLGSRVDKIVISNYIDLEALGFYTALSNLSLGTISIIFLIIATPLYPELAKSTSQKNKLEIAHSKYLAILTAITVPAALGLCFISTDFIKIFLPASYTHDSQPITWILIAAAFLYNLKGHYIDHSFQFLLKTNYLPWISLLSISLNIALTTILTIDFGIVGAAWAWLATNLISIIISYLLTQKLNYRHRKNKVILKVLISCLLMGAALYFGEQTLQPESNLTSMFSKVLIGITIYICSLILMNAFNLRTRFFSRQAKHGN